MPKKEKKRAVGRPRKYAGRRPTWTVRLAEDVGGRVRKIADESGRSISEVCEALIVQGLSEEIDDLRVQNRWLTRRVEELQASNNEASEAIMSNLETIEDLTSDPEGQEERYRRQNQWLSKLVEDSVERALARRDK